MTVKPDEIGLLIQHRLDTLHLDSTGQEIGIVIESGDGIVKIEGLPNAVLGGMIEFPNAIIGIALNLEQDRIVAVILGRNTDVKIGDWAKSTGSVMQVPAGPELLGRVVDAVGRPLDGLGPIQTTAFRPVEAVPPGVVDRAPVDTPLQTGYITVDALVPIGRGQRELIIGDRTTGKTTLAIDTIINQKGQDVLCIYVAVGKKTASVVEVVNILRDHDALSYTTIIDASADDPAAFQYLAPFSGTAMAEELMYTHHKDVLIVYDDLTRHANAYRMLSLLLQRPPGREAFPGDVFYLHSRLLERSAKLSPEHGGGSITALPIVETQKGDVSTYIPTNVISITDGQLFLQTSLFHSGFRPAVNAGISVSRVGGKAQTEVVRKLGGRLRLELARFREKEAFTAFASELDEETQTQLKSGQILIEILKQEKHAPLSVALQAVNLYLATQGCLLACDLSDVKKIQRIIIEKVTKNHSDILDSIMATKKLAPEIAAQLDTLFASEISQYNAAQNRQNG